MEDKMPDEVKETTTSEKAEETKSETMPEATKTTKKSNKTWLIVILIVVVLLIGLSVGGYFASKYVFNKAGEGLVEKVIESGTGGKVDIDTNNKDITVKTDEGTFNAGESVSWPSDMPSDVPKFSYGKITMATKISTDPKGWSIIISDVQPSNFTDYQNKLKAAGWTEVGSTQFGVSLIQMEKNNLDLNLTYEESSKGASLSISEKSAQ